MAERHEDTCVNRLYPRRCDCGVALARVMQHIEEGKASVTSWKLEMNFRTGKLQATTWQGTAEPK